MLYQHYFYRIHRIICLKKGPEEAEDLAHKVFIKALEHANTFRNQSSSFTWLYRITMNTIIDELRKDLIRKRNDHSTVQVQSLITKDFTPNVEMRIDLSRALSHFNELDREIVTLRFFVDCTLEEIASIVGMHKSAVKNRLYRALGRLRSELHDWGGINRMSFAELIRMVNIFEDKDNAVQNKAVTEELFNELKSNLERITGHLGQLNKKISIEIYPDLATFHSQTGKPDAPDWYIAMLAKDGTTIKIVSPLNPGPRHTYESVTKATLSLFASAIALDINKEIPIWLRSGIGHYEANQCWGDLKDEVKLAIQKGTFPKLSDLNGDWGNFTERKGHSYSYSIVEYIVVTYGYGKLREFIKHPNSYNGVFGLSQLEFEKGWIEYLTQNYA